VELGGPLHSVAPKLCLPLFTLLLRHCNCARWAYDHQGIHAYDSTVKRPHTYTIVCMMFMNINKYCGRCRRHYARTLLQTRHVKNSDTPTRHVPHTVILHDAFNELNIGSTWIVAQDNGTSDFPTWVMRQKNVHLYSTHLATCYLFV